MPVEPTDAGEGTLRVCTYNVWLMPPIVTFFTSKLGINVSPRKMTRASRIPESLPPNLDIIVLSEAFCPRSTDTLFEGLRDHCGLANRTKTLGSRRIGRVLSGGVVIVTKHAIVETDELLFGSTFARDDGLANKGVMYAKINLESSSSSRKRYVHVFASHTQAWDTPKCIQARMKQLGIIKSFIQSKSIPQDELVLVVGDLNVPRESEEYHRMLQELNCMNPHKSDLVNPTFNHVTNYLASGGPSSGGSSTTLDYILVSNDHAQPTEVNAETISVKSRTKYILNGKERDDLSDHYPVLATMTVRM